MEVVVWTVWECEVDENVPLAAATELVAICELAGISNWEDDNRAGSSLGSELGRKLVWGDGELLRADDEVELAGITGLVGAGSVVTKVESELVAITAWVGVGSVVASELSELVAMTAWVGVGSELTYVERSNETPGCVGVSDSVSTTLEVTGDCITSTGTLVVSRGNNNFDSDWL